MRRLFLRTTITLALLLFSLLQTSTASWGGDGPLAAIDTLLASGRYGEAAALGEAELASPGIPVSLLAPLVSATAQAAIKAGNSKIALRLIDSTLEKTIITQPSRYRLLNTAAFAAMSLGNNSAAARYLSEASGIQGISFQDQAIHFFLKGMLATQSGKEKEAEPAFAKAEEYAYNSAVSSIKPAIFLQQGKLALASGKTPKAILLFKSAIQASEKLEPDGDLPNILAEAGSHLHKLARGKDKPENSADSDLAMRAMMRATVLSLKLHNYRAGANAFSKAAAAAETEGKLNEALKLAFEAIDTSQKGNHADLLPSTQHLTARILKKLGRKETSLAMYRVAASNLELSKRGILPDCSSTTAQYHDTVRPVYMELAELLFDAAGAAVDVENQQKLLFEARNTLEMLKTEELRDYFGDACLGSEKKEITPNNLPPGIAVLYTVIFPERMELLLSLPDGMKRFTVAQPLGEIGRQVRMLRLTIENRFDSWEPPAKKLYDWIIRPLEQEFKRQNITRIVFVPDGPLRNIPLTVLHDGKTQIIERFSVVTLQNLAYSSRSKWVETEQSILMAGISESVQGYPALTNVEKELQGIGGAAVRRGSVTLLNSEFKLGNIKKHLESAPFPFLHFASHGEFTGSSRDNYILTWEGKMTLDDLENFIRSGEMKKNPVEILSLSACQTAAGDDRASLGLAGLAVKSGARNSIASLWDVEDKSTSELFIEFYSIVSSGYGGGKAEAFRMAQLKMRERYKHPYFWSPFLFIGAWL